MRVSTPTVALLPDSTVGTLAVRGGYICSSCPCSEFLDKKVILLRIMGMKPIFYTNLLIVSQGGFFMIPNLFYKTGYQMNTSSWPMFLLKTLNGSEMASATLFKKVRKML